LDDFRTALDTARTVAADSALAAQEDAAFEDAGPGPDGDAAGGDASEGSSQGWPAQGALTYDTYRNERYGFTVDYPANLLRPDEPVGDGHGQAFASPDGSASLLVYGTERGTEAALREDYETELARDDLRVTYQVIRSDWFVVSGYQGPYIFYQRTHRTEGGLRTFRLRHHATDKDYFDPIVERLSHSFAG
jgi:hypothetical protein